ncbi:MAG: peptidoglycan DD-metalloendopeptidase family protein [Miltoncostaeaceae bacterium]
MPSSPRRSRRPLVALCALVAALGIGVPTPGGAEPSAIEAQRSALAALEERLAEVDARAGAIAAEHNAALDRRDAVRQRMANGRREEARTVERLEASRQDLERRLVQLYVHGRPNALQVLLTSDSLTQVDETLRVLRASADADAAVVRVLDERRASLARLRARLAEDARRVAAEIEEAEARRAELEGVLNERRAQVSAAEQELGELLEAERRRQAAIEAARKARVEAEEKARREAERLLQQANAREDASVQGDLTPGEAPAPSDPAAIPTGSHVYPLAGASHFSDDWLYPRPGGRYHEGIDLFAARGTPVVAVAGGTLSRVGYSGISGNRLWLRDDAGTEFFYAHLDAFAPAAAEGARVEKGTVIGYNGDTGDARGTSPHVHFEIHPGGGGPIRPYPIVSAWPRVG